MKKIATKFVLVAASTFILGTAMAQIDTTKNPIPDTTKMPNPPDTSNVPPDTSALAIGNMEKTIAVVNINSYNKEFKNIVAITNRELLNAKRYAIKTEDEV